MSPASRHSEFRLWLWPFVLVSLVLVLMTTTTRWAAAESTHLPSPGSDAELRVDVSIEPRLGSPEATTGSQAPDSQAPGPEASRSTSPAPIEPDDGLARTGGGLGLAGWAAALVLAGALVVLAKARLARPQDEGGGHAG